MKRDIDYAATAVQRSFAEKYGRQVDLAGLEVVAHERTIQVRHGDHHTAGTRDALMMAIRLAETYDQFWATSPQLCADDSSSPS